MRPHHRRLNLSRPTPSQQAAQFTPVTASAKRDPVTSRPRRKTSSIADKWTAVAAPFASEASPSAPSSQFAPVDISAAPAPASTPVSSPGWEDVAAVNVVTDAPRQDSRRHSRPPHLRAHLPISNGHRLHPLHRVRAEQWSHTTPPDAGSSQQWSQTANQLVSCTGTHQWCRPAATTPLGACRS